MRPLSFLEEVASDIEFAIDFYDSMEAGAGDYFESSLMLDLELLGEYPGKHRLQFGFCRVNCVKFPFAIYYRDKADLREIAAVLDQRMNPDATRAILRTR